MFFGVMESLSTSFGVAWDPLGVPYSPLGVLWEFLAEPSHLKGLKMLPCTFQMSVPFTTLTF